MDDSSPLEVLLAEMKNLGRLDSSGSFTLDGERAQALLERYRLPSASYFMLHAVGAAVCAGATRVDVELRSDFFALSFDGQPFSAEDVQNCFGWLWNPGRSRSVLRLQELAIARAGALDWGAADFSLLPLPDGRHRIRVPKLGTAAKLMRLLGKAGRREEEDMLRQHLVSTPDCQIVLNGKAVDELQFPRAMLSATAIEAPDLLSRVGGRGRVLWLAELDWLGEERPLVLEGCQGLICRLAPGVDSPSSWKGRGDVLRSCWPGYLDVILNGRLYRCKLPGRWKDCWGIFWVNCLRRDLSHTFLAPADLELLGEFFARELE